MAQARTDTCDRVRTCIDRPNRSSLAMTFCDLVERTQYPSSTFCYSPGAMSEARLAMFVLVGFLLPVPILVWLDRRVDRSRGR